MKTGARRKILVARTDRLGDVLMTLPALRLLRESLPDAGIDFLCRRELHEILTPTLADWNITPVDFPRDSLAAARRELALRRDDAILFIYANSDLHWAALRNWTPLRFGLYSKFFSFITLTGGLRQRRSAAVKNEAEYNLEISRHFCQKLLVDTVNDHRPAPITLRPNPTAQVDAWKEIERSGISDGKKFFLVHPGMGNSALNLTAEDYLRLIEQLRKDSGLDAVVSIGPYETDQNFRQFFAREAPYLPRLEKLSLVQLMEAFRLAKFVVAPSTGPLHLAHYVGTPTIGIYPPVKSQRKERWAPWGGSGASEILAPQVACPGQTQCVGSTCPQYLCMAKADWASLAKAAINVLNFNSLKTT